jgi:hypothetical protein
MNLSQATTQQAVNDFLDCHSMSWDLSSYSVSSAEDDEHSHYFHLVGDGIIGEHEKEQSSPSGREHSQEDKCNFLFCLSTADQLIRKIFPFLFKPSAISSTQIAAHGKETVRNFRSPTSVIEKKGNMWAQMLTHPVNHLKYHNSLDRQRDACHHCCETRMMNTDFALHYLIRETAVHQGGV